MCFGKSWQTWSEKEEKKTLENVGRQEHAKYINHYHLSAAGSVYIHAHVNCWISFDQPIKH